MEAEQVETPVETHQSDSDVDDLEYEVIEEDTLPFEEECTRNPFSVKVCWFSLKFYGISLGYFILSSWKSVIMDLVASLQSTRSMSVPSNTFQVLTRSGTDIYRKERDKSEVWFLIVSFTPQGSVLFLKSLWTWPSSLRGPLSQCTRCLESGWSILSVSLPSVASQPSGARLTKRSLLFQSLSIWCRIVILTCHHLFFE